MTRGSASALKSSGDMQDVRRKLDQLADEGRTSELIELVLHLLTQMTETNNALSLRLQTALRELYGRKSQKVSTAQLSLLFAELGADDAAASALSAQGRELLPQPLAPPKPPARRKGRAPLPAHLERKQKRIAVAASERVCPQCGQDKACIGYRTSEVLDFVPAHFVIIEEQREKLACPRCPEHGVTTAQSDKVMDRGRPGPGLLAKVLVDKFEDSMPLYRQAQQCARIGMPLSPSTLGDWVSFALDALAPVAARITERVLSASYLRADDTGMPVQDRSDPRGIKRGHLWAFVGSGLVAFLYAPDWKAKHPAALLKGFQGFLQGDAYAGYNAMLHGDNSDEPIVSEDRRLACGMHIRAKFEKAVKLKDPRAAIALKYFKDIYRVEAVCKAEALPPAQRHARRQQLSLPLINAFYTWVHEVHLRLVPKSPLYVATYYAIHREQAFRRCFSDGHFEIDNGEVERQFRKVALGRKNFLFAGSDRGAERIAIAFTLFRSCSMHAVNPHTWATDVLTKLQDGWPRSRLDELLPDAWARAHAARLSASAP